jgi:hypothetical protein
MGQTKICFAAFLILWAPWASFGGVDVNVYDDAVYLYLDKLNAAGLLDTYMPDQRPLSRNAVAKLITEARENIDAEFKADESLTVLERLVGELEKEYSDSLSEKNTVFVPLDSFALTFTATNQNESPVPYNGLSYTTARVQPLLSYSEGDRFDGYGNLYSYSTHRVKATPYFAAYLQPKYFARSGEDSTGGIGLYRGYIKAGYKGLEVQIGRDDIRWGPGENALFFSGNARPLDMIKVSSPSPFRLPGFVGALGNFRATAFFSFLSDDYKPSNTTLSGYRVDYSPVKWWNIGFDHAVFLWGDGMAPPDFTTAVRSFLGLLASSKKDRADSNHLMGLDTTVRIPRATGAELYLKVLLEDTNANTGYMLKGDASWLGGIYFPKIAKTKRLSIRGEIIYTSCFSYLHGYYLDGFSLDGKFIGYDAGPDTYSGFVKSRYQINLDEFLSMDFRYLRRSNDLYNFQSDSTGVNTIGIIKVLNRPKEGNTIIRLGGQKRISRFANLYAEAGLDRKSNADFEAGKATTDFTLRIRLALHSIR